MNEETRFYHEQFQRNRPDLLADIKKPSQVESADKQEVEKLKMDVSDLKRELDAATDDMDRLTQLVNTMSQSTVNVSNFDLEPRGAHTTMHSSSFAGGTLMHDGSMPSRTSYGVAVMDQMDPLLPVTASGSAASGDEQTLPSFFPATANDPISLLEGPASNASQPIGNNKVDPELVDKLHKALATLPHETHTLLVERIVAAVVEPATYQAQVDAMTMLAASAANEATSLMSNTAVPNKEQESIELATSVLGAYIETIKKKHVQM
jgi:hypothetical protein